MSPLEVLAQTPSRIQSLISGVDDTVLRRRPGADKWSIAEIIAHLADSELVFGYRLRMILCVNGTQLQAFDPDVWASTLAYGDCDVHVAAEMFRALRTGNLHMLRRIADPLIDNSGTHEEWGRTTARSIIAVEAGHDLNHMAQIEGILERNQPAELTPTPQKPEIPIGTADQVDLRIGTIVEVVPIENADRLMKLTVNFGNENRTVLAGIRRERPDPQVLVGRQALFYYNVARRTIRGHVSEAMLCDVGHADGILPALLQPEWPVPNGTRAG
jgi:tRNA-binding protein